jgi:hypothetical protein
MRTKLIQLEERVKELEKMAREVGTLVKRLNEGDEAQPELSIKGHTWYLAAKGLIEKLYPEKVDEFDYCYSGERGMWHALDAIEPVDLDNRTYNSFVSSFAKARGMVIGSLERAKSLEFDAFIRLSSALVSDEFETSRQLFDAAKGDESILRAAGTVARVALERHLLTIAEARSVTITVHPPTKKKPEAQDALNSLTKAGVLTAIQKSELETLFRIGNYCAHPKESIKTQDVEKLIVRGKEMAATIV